MKKLLVPLMLGFGVALALLIGQRMSTDAMAVVIGVAVGVASSVPTSLLLVALLRRERAGSPPAATGSAGGAYPPPQPPNVIVLNPADLLGRHNPPPLPLPPMELSQDGGLRRLRVVGDEEEWT